MNYEEMSDDEINHEVAKHSFDAGWLERHYGKEGMTPDYCNDWADAGHVIDEIFSTLTSIGKYDDGIGFGERDMTVWQAQMHHNKCGKIRAAMIVYLMMRDEQK